MLRVIVVFPHALSDAVPVDPIEQCFAYWLLVMPFLLVSEPAHGT